MLTMTYVVCEWLFPRKSSENQWIVWGESFYSDRATVPYSGGQVDNLTSSLEVVV